MSNAPVIIGSGDMIEQASEPKWTTSKGYQLTRVFIGPESKANDKMNEMIGLGAEEVSRSGAPTTTVRAVFPGVDFEGNQTDGSGDIDLENDATDENATWELLRERIEKDIRAYPWYIGGLTIGEWLARVDNDVAHARYQEDYGYDAINHYRNMRIAGVDSYIRFNHTLRRTITTARQGTAQAKFSTALQVFQWADIKKSTKIKFQEPKYWDVASLSVTGSVVTTTWASVSFEWLRIPSEVRYDEGKKLYVVTQDWLGAAKWPDLGSGNKGGWSQTLYKGGSGTP